MIKTAFLVHQKSVSYILYTRMKENARKILPLNEEQLTCKNDGTGVYYPYYDRKD